MDVIPLLLPLFVMPGADQLAPVDVYTDGEAFLVDGATGDGHPLQDGNIATVQFTLVIEGGKEVANTLTRGLSYSLLVTGTPDGTPLVDALQGMRVGGERTMLFPCERMSSTFGPMPPKDSRMVMWVRLVAVRPAPTRPLG